MFERAVIESKVGFRALEDAELEVVSGGHINEDPIPSVFEDQLPSFGESIMPGIETWSLSADGGNSGDGYGTTYGDNWILVSATTNVEANGNHTGAQATLVNSNSTACNWAGALASVSTWTGTYGTILTFVPSGQAVGVIAGGIALGTGYPALLLYAGNDRE
ncbi:MAG: hypothetical protein AAFY47_05975, partial [Pseudomonadota bacterium]